MKRILIAVTCGGCLVARSRASASGWGEGRTTGAGGAWASVPPNGHDRKENGRVPVDDPNESVVGHGWGSGLPFGSSEEGVHDRGQPGADTGYQGKGPDDGNVGFHQQQFHDPSHTPHPSRWVGQQNGRVPVYDPNESAAGYGLDSVLPFGSSDEGVRDRGQPEADAGYQGKGPDDGNVGSHQQQFHDPSYTPHPSRWMGQQSGRAPGDPNESAAGHGLDSALPFGSSDEGVGDRGQPRADAGYQGKGLDDGNVGSHQQQFHDPSHTPHPSRWMGQQYDVSAQPHQLQHRPQQHQGIYGYDQYPQQGSPPGGPEPLRLRTKLRDIVSRVTGAGRPGQPRGDGRAGNGWDSGVYSGGGDGGIEGGKIGRTFAPQGSSWVGSASQHAGPSHFVSQTHPDANGGYGNEQNGDPMAAYEKPPGVHGGYGNQDRHVPTESFDPRGPPGLPTQEDRFGHDYTGAWEAPPSSAGAIEQTPNMFSGNTVGNDQASSKGSCDGNGSNGFRGYTGHDVGTGWAKSTPVSAQDTHGAVGTDFSPPRVQSSQSAYEPRETAIGQGWSSSDPSPTTSVSLQQEQPLEGDWSGQGGGMNASSASASATGATDESASITMREPVGERYSAPGSSPSSPPWIPPSDLKTAGDGRSEGLAAEGQRVAVDTPPAERLIAKQEQNDSIQASESADSRGAIATGAEAPTFATGALRPDGDPLGDTMPSSADHGMEEVDWGEDAAGDGEEGDDLVKVFGPRGEDEEEVALIRELERMERIGAEERLGGAREESPTLPPPLDELEGREEDAAIDAAVEHRLDVLFDSILEDGDAGAFDDAKHALSAPDSKTDEPACAPALSTPLPSALPSDITKETGPQIAQFGLAGEGSAADGRQVGEEALWKRDSGTYVFRDESRDAFESRREEHATGLHVNESTDAKSSRTEPVAAELDTVRQELEPATSSLWGKSGRWASLPRLAEVLSQPESEQEDEGGDKEGAAGVVMVDPFELPPSAATDEIWNDQHLQDQLDAYWEQSRRGRDWAGVDGGSAPSSSVRRQLATYGGNPQTAYGPGDWVGKASEMVQDPLPAVVDGVARIVKEPLAGAPNGAVRASWVSPPRLFDGNRAPINIYGNVHVHLESGKDTGKESPPTQEVGARERYFSQGETSWSGSGRAGGGV